MTPVPIHTTIFSIVKKTDIQILIAYSNQNPELKDCAETMQRLLSCKEVDVIVKPAVEVTIPQILASDVILLGADESAQELLCGDFKELARLFRGINLAGRIGGFFSVTSQESLDTLQGMSCDTGLKVLGTLKYDNNAQALSAWIEGFAKKLKE